MSINLPLALAGYSDLRDWVGGAGAGLTTLDSRCAQWDSTF